MPLKTLIESPVGSFSAAGRWYLFTAASLLLLLLAGHYSMQEQAQLAAEKYVADWGQQEGVTVGEVRYRALRGALTLIDIRAMRDKLKLSIPLLQMRGNLSAILQGTPFIESIEVRGGRIVLSSLPELGDQSSSSVLTKLWQSAGRITAEDVDISILQGAKWSFPNRQTSIHIDRSLMNRDAGIFRSMTKARWQNGEIELSSFQSDRSGSSGELTWRGVDTQPLFDNLLGLQAPDGNTEGSVSWKSEGAQAGDTSVDGFLVMHESSQDARASRLDWHGLMANGQWRGDVDAARWPLRMVSEKLPDVQGRSMSRGRLNGSIHFETDQGGLTVRTEQAELSGLVYRRTTDEVSKAPDWHIASLTLKNGELKWPSRRAVVGQAVMRQAMLAVDAEEQAQTPSQWSLDIRQVELADLSLQVMLANGSLHLPLFDGQGSLTDSDRLEVKLQSDSASTSQSGETWRLQGAGSLSGRNHHWFSMQVKMDSAPLSQFRALLPTLLREKARDISGLVDARLDLTARAEGWSGSGTITVADPSMVFNGEQWSAGTVELDLERIGTMLPEQQIERLEVRGWHYIAALSPMLFEPSQDAVPDHPASNAVTDHLKISHLYMKNGSFSVGQADSVWLSRIDMALNGLQTGKEATAELTADMGEGRVRVSGKVEWKSQFPAWKEGKVTVRDSLPFFMNDWLIASGLPPLLRGRLYGDLTFTRSAQGLYQGLAYLRLQYGLLGKASSDDDVLFKRIGYSSRQLFSGLNQGRKLRLRIPLQGEEALLPTLGESLLLTLKSEMKKDKHGKGSSSHAKAGHLASFRLRDSGSLSLNERSRLKKVLIRLWKHPKESIELRTRLSELSDRELERARFTLHRIEEYLVYRKLPLSRLFPVWIDSEQRQSAKLGSIDIYRLP